MSSGNTKQHQKESKLSTKIAVISGGILSVVFAVLIISSVTTTRASMMRTIASEFEGMAKISGLQVQQIIASAESVGGDIGAYLQKAYTLSGQGKRNMLGRIFRQGETKQKVIESETYVSAVYNLPISELSADVEKYLVETARHIAVSNDDIAGIGVMFEPDAFGGEIKDYSFYINKNIGNGVVKPYGSYVDYSQQDFYKKAVEAKSTVFIDPYEHNGVTMVTVSMPVYHKDTLQCVIKVDIDVMSFAKVANLNEKYPSMYTTVLNKDGIIVFDTEDIKNVGLGIQSFFKVESELKAIGQKLAEGQPFETKLTENGVTMDAFFYPIAAGDSYWWSFTALTATDMNRDIVNSAVLLVAMSVAALIIIAGMILALLRSTLKPIDGIVHAAESISEGNLDIQLQSRSNDEIGRLSRAFDTTGSRLRAIIGDINYLLGEMANGNFACETKSEESYVGEFRNVLLSIRKINVTLSSTLAQINEASAQVSSGSGQVSSGSQALSQGATEQASSVEELAATINEISEKVRSNALNAQQASKRASLVGDEIVQSNQQMQQMISAMSEINRCSDEIGKIIKTIEDIAFQTNILALNAAVEAARAGAAGKGFAVVADEVRNLAGKSAEASKNTAGLIEQSIKAVENGTRIADATAKSLLVVVDGAKQVADTVDRISEASNEQAGSIAQVTQGVDQISGVVQTNSATAQQSAAASEELSGQAMMLKQLVGRFRLSDQNTSLSVRQESAKISGGPVSANDKY